MEQQQQYREQRLFNVDHGQHARAHRDAPEHHRLRLVIGAADHPGAVKYLSAVEERHAVTRQLFHEIPNNG
jgi:hypothetical protein